jgi:hypothetical protein
VTAPQQQPPHLITALADLDEPAEQAPARRQAGQRWLVQVEGADPFTVRVTNRDRIAMEKTFARHKDWPAPADAPNFAVTFLTWNAAKRAGDTALTFDQWAEALEDFDRIGEEPADPTR